WCLALLGEHAMGVKDKAPLALQTEGHVDHGGGSEVEAQIQGLRLHGRCALANRWKLHHARLIEG
ncbi:unnamed protein product, partial [Ilex paraguariensis]